MSTVRLPRLGEKPSLAREMAFALADLYRAADSHVAAPNPVLHVSTQGDQVKLGICIAADALRKALERHEEGLVALGDYERILDALRDEKALTAGEISQITGMSVEQVCRRLPELEREGLTRVVQFEGNDLVRNGYRVWEVV